MSGSPQPNPNNSERLQLPPEVLEVTNDRRFMLQQAEQRYMAALLALRESVRAMDYQRASMAGQLVGSAQEDLHMARQVFMQPQPELNPVPEAPAVISDQPVEAPQDPLLPAQNPLIAHVTSLYPKTEPGSFDPEINAQSEIASSEVDEGPVPITKPSEGESVADNVASLADYRAQKEDTTAQQIAEARAAVAGIYEQSSGEPLVDPEIKPHLIDGLYHDDWNQKEAA